MALCTFSGGTQKNFVVTSLLGDITSIFFIAFCMVIVATPAPCADDEYDYKVEIDSELMKIYSNKDQCTVLREAIDFLSEEIKKRHDSIYLHKLRGPLYFLYSDFNSAREDINFLIKHDGSDVESMMKLCVINEAETGKSEKNAVCYENIVNMYKKQIVDRIRKEDGNYVYALLMAEMPEAEAVREQYLKGLGNSMADEEERKSLQNFVRESAVPRYPRCPDSPQP
jgi:hypothetical protein